MAIDTFDWEMSKEKLEIYEWDDVWWDNSRPDSEAHILLIGDSISRGYRHIFAKMFTMWSVDSFATSKALDNEFFKPSLELMFAQQRKYDIILFNNGLHGFHLDADEYERYYLKMLTFLKEKNDKLAVVLSTRLLDKRDSVVCERNIKASECADKLGLPVIDTYSFLLENEQFYIHDNAHLTNDGYSYMASLVGDEVKKLLKK